MLLSGINWMNELVEVANRCHNGHFTLLKFTSNWRCCLGTILDTQSIPFMAEGKTMEAAIKNCLDNDIHWVKIHEELLMGIEDLKFEQKEFINRYGNSNIRIIK